MEPCGSDAQYHDWREHFWAAIADCGAAWAIEPDCLFHRVCGSSGDCGVFGGGGIVFSGGWRAISLRARSIRTICGDSDWMAYLVVAHFCLLGGGESFHYVPDGVCAGGECTGGARRSVDCANWIFGGS